MKLRTIVLMMILCFVAVAVGFASDPNMGTGKLNEAKSKFPPNAPKNNKVVYEAAGDNVKVTVDGVDGQGRPLITSGRESSMGKTTRSPAIRTQTRGRTRRLMTARPS
ncbi:MAG: hypothetical protein WB660_27720 [Candidatus Sulfotelmatobacter sp.]